jgi:hypothetical protein
MSDRRTKKPSRRPVPLSMPEDLEEKIEQVSDQVKLSKQDVMRLSMERGLPVLVAQLLGGAGEPEPHGA